MPVNFRLFDSRPKLELPNVTLVGVDCIDVDRLAFAADICQRHINFAEVKLLSHIPSSRSDVIPIAPLLSIEAYSEFIVKELYKYVDTEYALIFQYDGFVLNPIRWKKEFLDYDYIGAHWDWIEGKNTVGNGGFSLRSRSLLERLATDPRIEQTHPEDTVICITYGDYLMQAGFKFAPVALAKEFSTENDYWKGEFGFHNSNITDWNVLKYLGVKKYKEHRHLIARMPIKESTFERRIRRLVFW